MLNITSTKNCDTHSGETEKRSVCVLMSVWEMIKRTRFLSSIVDIQQIVVTLEKKIRISKLLSYIEG